MTDFYDLAKSIMTDLELKDAIIWELAKSLVNDFDQSPCQCDSIPDETCQEVGENCIQCLINETTKQIKERN